MPSRTVSRSMFTSARTDAKSSAGHGPSSRPRTVARYSLAPISSRVVPRSATRSPSRAKWRPTVRVTSSRRPTIPTVGVGRIETPSVSL